ncbi:hypothetical protein, partial [Brevundimonas sp.]|uniref:hypothetical protein n=1 Tax=Brevundimonas sp. TaxID=1871086 RepID=UPI0025BF5B4E
MQKAEFREGCVTPDPPSFQERVLRRGVSIATDRTVPISSDIYSEVVNTRAASGTHIAPDLLAHVSPLG